jgi:hypothetical protein
VSATVISTGNTNTGKTGFPVLGKFRIKGEDMLKLMISIQYTIETYRKGYGL